MKQIKRQKGECEMHTIFKTFICICLSLILSTSMAFAAQNDDSEIGTCALNYNNASTTISISDSGTATVNGRITGLAGRTTKMTLTLYLQKYENGSWKNVTSWQKESITNLLTLTKTKAVTSGYKYRTKASFYAYAGTNSEHFTLHSSQVTY